MSEPAQPPQPEPEFWKVLPQIVGRLKNEFLLVTLGIFILAIAIGLFAPGIVDSLGAAFFYLLVVLAWLAYLVGRVLDAWLKLRQTQQSEPPPKGETAPSTVEPGPKASPLAKDGDLRARYLRHLLRECNQVSLAGIDPGVAIRPEAAELDLHEIFTGLDVVAAAERPETGPGAGKQQAERQDNRQPAIAALVQEPRLVLLGKPGAGKSTLVRFLAVCLAGDGLGLAEINLRRLGEEWTLPRLLPVRVVLRDYAARGLPANVGLWDFVAAELERADPGSPLARFAPDLKRELEQDGGLLLLDGLDEVPDARQRREQLKTAVERFALDFPRCRILVTSRPYAYQNPAWHLRRFPVRRLADFSPEQIQEFIRRWYSHIAHKDAALSADDAERFIRQLQRAVQTNPRLAELAPRPLLLTLMASIHRWRQGGALPEKRQELYEESVKLLIDLWQKPKQRFDAQGDPVGDEYDVWQELHITPDRLRAALNQVAFQAHRDQPPTTTGTHDIPLATLAGALYAASEEREKLSIDRVCRYVRDRAGLLVDRGSDVFAFPHRTFQEYLAACHLTEDEFPDKLARLLRQDDERWREALLLAAAKAAGGVPASVWWLAETLCPAPVEAVPNPQEADWYAALRAAQALVETEQHRQVAPRDRPKLERLQNWLVALLRTPALAPPERAAAGRALADLPAPDPQGKGGDPRFDPGHAFLPQEPMLGFVPIPAGPFLMGSNDYDDDDDEKPQHELYLPDYYIARYPVTVAQWRAFVQDSGHRPTDPRSLDDPGNHPVHWVTWYEAVQYCDWLAGKMREWANEQMSKWANEQMEEYEFWRRIAEEEWQVALPSEAEWEKAARGGLPAPSEGAGVGVRGTARRYPWGDTPAEDKPDPNRANYEETGIGTTSAVGCFPGGASPYGVEDLSGNVWEWTRSLYQDYPYDPDDGREKLDDNRLRVLRGGSFLNRGGGVRAAVRYRGSPDYHWNDFGLRVGVVPVRSER